MGRIKDIDAEMHELPDFEKGIQFERERIVNLIKDMTNGLPVKNWNNTDLWYLRDSIIKAIVEKSEGI